MIRGHALFFWFLCIVAPASGGWPHSVCRVPWQGPDMIWHMFLYTFCLFWKYAFDTLDFVLIFCNHYDLTSVIPLYIFSTYFVLTPFLRGLRFHAAQVQTTGSLIHPFRIILGYFGTLSFSEPIFWYSPSLPSGYVPYYGYDGALSRLMIMLCSVEVCGYICVGSVHMLGYLIYDVLIGFYA